jgi:hypothetical protein
MEELKLIEILDRKCRTIESVFWSTVTLQQLAVSWTKKSTGARWKFNVIATYAYYYYLARFPLRAFHFLDRSFVLPM